MTEDVVETKLVPLAAELIGNVRDYDPADNGALLNREGIVDPKARALIVVLAAMVDPDRRPSELLAWTTAGPVQSRDNGGEPKKKGKRPIGRRPYPREHGTDRGYYQHRTCKDWPACDPCLDAHAEASYPAAVSRRKRKKKAS